MLKILHIIAADMRAYEPPIEKVVMHPELIGTFRKIDTEGFYMQRRPTTVEPFTAYEGLSDLAPPLVSPVGWIFDNIPVIIDATLPVNVIVFKNFGREAGRIILEGLQK